METALGEAKLDSPFTGRLGLKWTVTMTSSSL